MKKVFKAEHKILVTRPFLPPRQEVEPYLDQIWESRWLTNFGRLQSEFAEKLAEYLDVSHISLFSNGTLALMAAMKLIGREGEVVTTPFTFVATTHSLWWNDLNPVFADIEPDYLNLDPDRVDAAITEDTVGILPVHVFGRPCDVKRLQEIADEHNLRLVYDAAHTFGAKLNGRSLASYGEMSVLSFHATKVFNTFDLW